MCQPTFVDHFSFSPVPEIPGKAAIFPLYFTKHPGIDDSRLYFQPIPDDSEVISQGFQLVLSVCTDRIQVKAIEGFPKRLPLVQNTLLGQPSLKTFQHQHLKQLPIIINGNAPFLIMVTDVPFILWVCPAAAFLSV